MLATGLLILKIIGFILLGILGLILALILMVLLVPLRYRAEVSYYGEAKAKASVSWLLHIVSCKVIYDGELDVGIRIFGFRVGKKRDAEDAASRNEQEPCESQPQELQPAQRPEEAPEQTQKELEEEILKELEEERQEELRAGQKKTRLKRPFSFQPICDKLKAMSRQKDRVTGFLEDEENKQTFRLLWRQLKALIRHILPTDLRGKVRFGFDDPYTTGQVLTYISPFYSLYGKKFRVIPVFEEPVMEGEGWLKGRIRFGTVLILGIRVLLDQNFRKLLRQWRK